MTKEEMQEEVNRLHDTLNAIDCATHSLAEQRQAMVARRDHLLHKLTY